LTHTVGKTYFYVRLDHEFKTVVLSGITEIERKKKKKEKYLYTCPIFALYSVIDCNVFKWKPLFNSVISYHDRFLVLNGCVYGRFCFFLRSTFYVFEYVFIRCRWLVQKWEITFPSVFFGFVRSEHVYTISSLSLSCCHGQLWRWSSGIGY